MRGPYGIGKTLLTGGGHVESFPAVGPARRPLSTHAMRTTLLLASLLALTLPSQGHAEVDLRAIVKEVTLDNGMKWLVIERPQAPVFTGFIRVKVGGADEQPGITGLAHLFEHMAFKGTPVLGTTDFEKEKQLLLEIAEVGDKLAVLERAGKGEAEEAKALAARLAELSAAHDAITDENEFTSLYQINGANGLNATTDKDLTSYFVSFPSNRLELWALSEAQRLASPVLRDFYKERDVVLEERRLRVDSDPGGALYEELNQVSFTMSPYRWPVVGYREDLESMTLEQAHAFHRRFYAPANTVGTLVGDVKFEEVVPLLQRTFGAIPAQKGPPPLVFAEPPKRQTRRSTVYFDASPRLMMAFKKPTLPSRDDYVFDVLTVLLGEGNTSRLTQRLVFQDRIAQGVGVFGAPGSRLDNLFVLIAIPLAGVPMQKIEQAIFSELERLKTEKVSEAELEKVRNRVAADHARSLDTNYGLASRLSYFEAVAGDWRYTADHPKVIEGITADDVIRVAKEYFTPDNLSVVDLARPQTNLGGAK